MQDSDTRNWSKSLDLCSLWKIELFIQEQNNQLNIKDEDDFQRIIVETNARQNEIDNSEEEEEENEAGISGVGIRTARIEARKNLTTQDKKMKRISDTTHPSVEVKENRMWT